MEGGFLGKTLLTLVYNRGGSAADPPPLPNHKLTPHDIVAVRPASASAAANGAASEAVAQGVVYRVRDSEIVVAVEDVDDAGALDVPLRLDKLANKVTYERMRHVLKDLSASDGQKQLPGKPLLDVVFHARPPALADSAPAWKGLSGKQLDASQQAAVDLVLASQDLALIHGPPGTRTVAY